MQDRASLVREVAEQRAALARLQDQLDRVLAQLEIQTATNAKLNERIAELLVVVQRKSRRPAAPPKVASTPEAPPVTGAAQAAFEDRPRPPEKPPQPASEKKPRRPSGRKPIPTHLETEAHVLRPDACGGCGGNQLRVVDEVEEVKLHVVKEHQRRRVVKRTTVSCAACGHRTTPRSLPSPYERSKVTCEWLAWLIHTKFGLLSPLDRIRRDLASRDIHLAMGTLVNFVERAADILAPIDGLHWKQLLADSWMATDGTGLKVLVPKLPEAHDGYLELYRNESTAVFQYSPDKSSDDVVSKLREFRGKLTADAEHRFNAVYTSGAILECGCNAHGRRKFRDAEDTQPVLAREGGGFIGAMYGEEEKAQKLGLTGEALVQHRRARIGPIVAEFQRWLAAVEPTLLPSEPLMAAVRYYRNHKVALFRFIDEPRVPIDNSATEREYQNVAKLRLNMLFAGSTEGAHRACVLLGIVATCRAVGVPPQAYMAWVFERLGTHRDLYGLPLEALTPAAFKKSMG